MEFFQFHPTGMVWPPGVMGILVTEGVRGEGGILRNATGERFMWRYLPEARRHEYAETEQEAREWVEAAVAGRQTQARRPPELSTRDNVARAIYTEVKEGRGSPHGGAFLDISYLPAERDRKSTRLNSSHVAISYADRPDRHSFPTRRSSDLYAETEQEAREWVEAAVAGRQTQARRPPELSTRDNVARAIYTEVKEGRGSPHGGAFLDISYLPAE